MVSKEPEILYEDKHIIVCVKPAGVPSQSDRTGGYDLVSQLKNYVAMQNRAGNGAGGKSGSNNAGGSSVGKRAVPRFEVPYIAPVHRLDRPVGGVMVFAKTKAAAAALSKQVQEHQMMKRYFCVVTGLADAEAGLAGEQQEQQGQQGQQGQNWNRLIHLLKTDKRTNLSAITAEKEPETVRAELLYQVIEQIQPVTPEPEAPVGTAVAVTAEPAASEKRQALIEVELLTGRHHQIRVQMTAISDGIWGDTKYNELFTGKKGWYDLALFSHELSFRHPVTGKVMHFTALPAAGGVFDQFAYIQRLRLR